MSSRILRAYLCTKGACSMMGTDLAAWAAKRERPVLMLPAVWLLDPYAAPEEYRYQISCDRDALGAAGKPITFPIMIEEPIERGARRIIGPEDWLEFIGR